MYATVFLRAKSGVTDKGITMKSRAARYVPEPTLQLLFISTAMDRGCEDLESLCSAAVLGWGSLPGLGEQGAASQCCSPAPGGAGPS